MIAGAGNVVIFNRICSWPVRKVASGGAAGCRFAFSGSDHARNGLGSVAHWKCHFSCFQYMSRMQFCVAGAVFGEVGNATVSSAHCKSRFICDADQSWDIPFAWQAQYLVRLEMRCLLLRAL